ncbi:MAG TPA: glycosyltransferase [Acidimicrobiales bacterium]|nr:glycosyltransferase [Acidimicrobiales bacterium]
MKVVVWPADLQGCGHYRLILPAQALQQQGADVHIDTVGPVVNWDRKWPGADDGLPPGPDVQYVSLAQPVEADVVVIQRPGRRWWADMIPDLHKQGVRVVVDVDDLFDGLSKSHVGHGSYRQTHVHHEWIDRACQQADLVTATTAPLISRYGHGHGILLPNLVPAAYLAMSVPERPNTIGWSGVVGTHPGDLQTTEGTVQQVLARTGWTFHTIGPVEGVQQALRLREKPSATGWVMFDDYPYALAELQVGIVPLEDSAFNHAKSCLKAMEMAALGVPVVMSPTPDNLRLHRAGVGMLASSRGQWARTLGRLCASRDARTDLAGEGRRVMADLTYETHCDRWWDTWTAPIEKRSAA